MLQAMTTGHEGSLSTLHASSPADALRRLQTLALMGDLDLPYRAVADQVASALHLVVHQARLADGTRRIVEIAAVAPGADGAVLTPLARWRSAAREGEHVVGAFHDEEAAAGWRAGAEADAELGDDG
jgi:pilus assembly protein CpaF